MKAGKLDYVALSTAIAGLEEIGGRDTDREYVVGIIKNDLMEALCGVFGTSDPGFDPGWFAAACAPPE